jgi:hypothetical protein
MFKKQFCYVRNSPYLLLKGIAITTKEFWVVGVCFKQRVVIICQCFMGLVILAITLTFY